MTMILTVYIYSCYSSLGTKTFIVIDPAYSQDLYADEHFLFAGISTFNGDAIDFKKFPKLANVPYYEVTIYPGT